MSASGRHETGEGARLRVLVPLLALLVSACGFHLRGAVELPEELRNIYLDTSDSNLTRELNALLSDGGAEVVNVREDADVILKVGPGIFNRRVLSFDPDTGKELEIEIAYALAYSARRADGEVLQQRRVLTLQRSYVFDAGALLGTTRQETTLRKEMQRDAVQQLLRQLGERFART